MTKRVVFDTNVLLSALIRHDTPPALAFDRARNLCTLLTSSACMDELRGRLYLPKFARYFSHEEADILLETLEAVAERCSITEAIVACRDPKDDKFLELAVAGNANCIVSGDPDLLDLHPFRGIQIFSPREFLDFEL
ncbi:MAG: putative toxin-antitoxin system toxin component, PIN family [Saprospiraceae bacterium]